MGLYLKARVWLSLLWRHRKARLLVLQNRLNLPCRPSQSRACYCPRTIAALTRGVTVLPPATTTRPATIHETPSCRDLRGVVGRITFRNPENGFTVARGA